MNPDGSCDISIVEGMIAEFLQKLLLLINQPFRQELLKDLTLNIKIYRLF